MTSLTSTSSVCAALLCVLGLTASAAHAAGQDRVQYRADLRIDGAWSESVRAGADEDDSDGDGREEVAARDQDLRFTVSSTVPQITFRGGRPAERTTSVQHSFPSLTVGRSTLTEPNGEAGACRTHEPGTGGSAEVVATAGRFVFRPAEDVIFQLVCSTEHLEWGFAMDAMRAGGPLGQAPLDASFAIAPTEVGAQRIVRTVAASPAQRSLERCPREDPGHTTACRFEWAGSVVLERTDAARAVVRRPRLAAGARSASAEVVCRTACSPVLSLAGSKRRLHAPAGTSRVVLPLGPESRRAVLRAGRGVLKARLDGRIRSFALRARRAL